ncbi:membrane protein [Lacticaseibacillus rhamnosus]|uniref:membrane protein n=1 Tax=Lacticaseibacillus rhamnosus TaxID=47715 RepID=UPI00065ACADA|nr:membrane protein [Lacticaseibacillus rhamnosus]KMO46117.1 membrane protein [Lacticaseibacillus rhamnosus]OAT98872.1 membrane protein [Lacticaseibacillus rhamnosus]
MTAIKHQLVASIGAAIVGIGVGICITTELGADALGALWEGLATRLPISVGQASLVVTVVCVIMVLLINPRHLGIGTLLNPLVTSLTTDFIILRIPTSDNPVIKMILLVIGILLIAIGSGIAAAANRSKEGYIALNLALAEKFSGDIAQTRFLMDLICFVGGMILGGKIMIGPVIGILMIGFVFKQTLRFCEPIFRTTLD